MGFYSCSSRGNLFLSPKTGFFCKTLAVWEFIPETDQAGFQLRDLSASASSAEIKGMCHHLLASKCFKWLNHLCPATIGNHFKFF